MASILLVDDNDQLRELLAEVLVANGHDVIQASDGRIAITLLRERRFSLVVTDVVMPEADGAEVMAAVCSQTPRPRLIVMSGGGQIDAARYLQMAKMLGADVVLPKPFRSAVLIEAVGRLLAPSPSPPG